VGYWEDWAMLCWAFAICCFSAVWLDVDVDIHIGLLCYVLRGR
jgi:hypothetical protein